MTPRPQQTPDPFDDMFGQAGSRVDAEFDSIFGSPGYPTAAPEPDDAGGGFAAALAAPFKAFGRGVNVGATATVPQLAGNVLETLGDLGIVRGGEVAGERIEEFGERRGAELSERYGESPSFRDAPIQWVAENLGRAVPTAVPAIGAAAAGGPLAALGVGAAMGAGDIRGELEDAGMDPSSPAGLALTVGGAPIYGAADMLMPARVGGAIAKGAAAKGFGPIFQSALRSGLEEGVAEGAQSLVSQGAAAIGTGQDVDWARIGEEAVRGAAAGPFFGAGGQVVASRRQARPGEIIQEAPQEAADGDVEPDVEVPDPWAEIDELARQEAAAAPPVDRPAPDAKPTPEPVVEPVAESPPSTEVEEAATAEPGTIPEPDGTIEPEPETPARVTEPEAPSWTHASIVDPGRKAGKRQDSVFPGDDRKVKTEYQVMEAGQGVASHTSGYAQRPDTEFPAEIQGSAYHGPRGQQAREHTEMIVTKFDPERALDTTLSVAEGPPVVTENGIAVAGNGRIIAQQRLYESRPDAGQALKEEIIERAGEFGIDPEQVARMERPVLVRRIVDPKVDVTDVNTLRELNASSDQPIGKTKDPISEAATRAASFREANTALEHFTNTAEPDATIRSYLGSKGGRDFLTALVDDGVITRAERARYADATTGAVTDEGKQLVERMFYVAALGDPETVSRAPAGTLRKLDTSLPAIIRADRVGGDWQIGGTIKEALDFLAAEKASGMTRQDFMGQSDFLGNAPDPSESVLSMADFLANRKGDVRDAFRDYANKAEAFARQTQSDDLFGFEPEGPEDAGGFYKQAALEPRPSFFGDRDANAAAQAQLDAFGFVAEPVVTPERQHEGQENIFGDRNPELAEGWESLGMVNDRHAYRDPEGNTWLAPTDELVQVSGKPKDARLASGIEQPNAPPSFFTPVDEDSVGSGNLFLEQRQPAGTLGLAPSAPQPRAERDADWQATNEQAHDWNPNARQRSVFRRARGFIDKTLADREPLSAEDKAAAEAEPIITPFDIPEIRDARRRARSAPRDTHLIDTPERDRLRYKVAQKMYDAGIENRKKDRKAWVVLGPPGAGKTTAMIGRIKKEEGALEIDSDIAKSELPEFDGGLNAAGVHKESKFISELVLARAIAQGDNIAIPKVGSGGTSSGKIVEALDELQDAGYEVHLALVELDPILSAGRSVTRYLNNGRFVDPIYSLHHVGDNPPQAYDALKGHPAVKSFSRVDQDVPYGSPPRPIEEGTSDDIRLEPAQAGPVAAEGRGRDGQPGSLSLREVERSGGRGVPSAQGVHPLAPTAQLSEKLRDAGEFRDGTADEAPKATAIVRDLQKVLHEHLQGVKVAEGGKRIFRKALAVVTPKSQVVRSRSLSDVAAIGHEYGHLMQKLLLGSVGDGEISNEQLAKLPGAARGELEDLARGISDQSLVEGWAEFWRRYLDNPTTLENEAPNALEWIEERLGGMPAVRNAWQEAREQWQVHRDASPQARLRSHVSVGESDPDALSIDDKWMRFRTNIFDDFEPIRKVVEHVRKRTGKEVTIEEDAETLARLTRGATGIADMFIGEKKGDRYVGGAVEFGTGERIGKSLAEILEPVGDRLDDFRDYMIARRARELHRRDIMTGIRDEDVEWTLNELEGKWGEEFKSTFADLQDYNESLLQYLADSGVISQDALVEIRKNNRDYVPFYRVHEGKKGGIGGGSGFGTLWSPVKRLKGSGRDIIDPLESTIKNTYSYVQLAQKQRVSTALAALAEKEGVGDLFEQLLQPMQPTQFKLGEITGDLKKTIPGFDQLMKRLGESDVDVSQELLAVFRPGDYIGKPNTISVLKDGKRQWYEVDPELFKSLEGLETEQLDGWVRWLGAPARWLRAGATLAPEFMIRSPLRDQTMAFIASEYGFRPGWDFAKGVAEYLKKGEAYEELKVSGGTYGTMHGLDRDSMRRNIDKLVQSGGVPNVVKNPLDLLRALGETIEMGSRMGEFMRAREKGASLEEAGSAAREVSVDFARHGAKTTALRSLSAFWNARLQGYDQLGRAFKRDPLGTAAKTFASVTLPSLMEYFAYRDDEEYWEIPQWQRDIFWIAKVGDTWLRIPKPFELGLIFGTMPSRVISAIDGTPGGSEEVRRFFEDTLSKEVTSIGPTPTAVMPLIENLTNWSFFMQRPVVPRSEQDVRAREQGDERTSEVAKMLARWSPGPQGVSPRKIDNLLYAYTGGLGRIATHTVDETVELVTGAPKRPARTPSDIPGVRGVTVRTPGLSSESVERLYRELGKARTAHATLRHFQREGDRERWEKEARDPEQAALRALLPRYEAAADALSKIRSQVEMIRRDEDMSPAEKRERIDELGDRAIDVARRGLGKE